MQGSNLSDTTGGRLEMMKKYIPILYMSHSHQVKCGVFNFFSKISRIISTPFNYIATVNKYYFLFGICVMVHLAPWLTTVTTPWVLGIT
jgi:hypothetical protein